MDRSMPPSQLCNTPYNCHYQHQCYDDFRPRWNSRLSLRSLIVRQSDWTWLNASLNEWQLKAGYLDVSATYKCYNRSCGDLSFKIAVAEVPQIILVGIKTPERLLYYVGKYVPDSQLSQYTMSLTAVKWNYSLVKSAVYLTGLPLNGQHVITLRPNHTECGPECDSCAALTHVITWLARKSI